MSVLCAYMSIYHLDAWYSRKPEEGAGTSRPLIQSAKDGTQVLWRSNKLLLASESSL